ncbi:MAG: HAMP domain-containing protein [Anaerolineales bacterium]
MNSIERGSFFLPFWKFISSVSVRVKILGMALGLVLLLGIGITIQVWASLTYILQAQIQNQSVISAHDLAARATDPILLNDLVGLQKLLLETQQNNPDVIYAFIVNNDRQILAHTFGDGFPLGLLDANTADPEEHHHTVVLQSGSMLVWDTAVPIFDGRAGTVRIGISDTSQRNAIQTLTGQLLLTIVLVSALVIIVATFLTFVLTRPLHELVNATQRVAQGDFTPRVPRWANDEIGDLALAFNAMTIELGRMDDIRREREQLRRQLLEKVIRAQEDERSRIARELHDSTSQNLTSLMVGLKNLQTTSENHMIAQQVENLRLIAAKTLEEVHEISSRLRPRILDDIGLSAAIEKLTHEWQARYKIPVDLLIHGVSQRLPGEIETALYRIVQESLTNVARHARAHSVSVLIERRGNLILAIIEDDGGGFDPAQSFGDRHLGVAGMRERAELLGGKLTIESQIGSGTSIHVQIPINK